VLRLSVPSLLLRKGIYGLGYLRSISLRIAESDRLVNHLSKMSIQSMESNAHTGDGDQSYVWIPARRILTKILQDFATRHNMKSAFPYIRYGRPGYALGEELDEVGATQKTLYFSQLRRKC
jgi:hypothetical protein